MRDFFRLQFTRIRAQPIAVQAIWAVLAFEAVAALAQARLSLAAVALATIALTLVPLYVTSRLHLRLPTAFLVGITLFVFMTIWLGEEDDYYTRFWWWDVILHGGSAFAFGLLGFLFAFVLFQGDRYAAPSWALGLIGFTIAVSIGAVWEIFEYAMDRNFGTDMQKSGLRDTMWDLIVDVIGAAVGGASGALWVHNRGPGFTRALLRDFVERNRRLFGKFRD